MAEKLVDMKYTKAELKEEKAEYASPGGNSPYPWGLCIRLEEDELKKLGIKDLPAVGSTIRFTAEANVTGVNKSAAVGQEDETCVALQITAMQIEKEASNG